MVHFAGWLPDITKCSPVASKLTWTNIGELLTISDRSERDFYLSFSMHERWSKRTLRAKIAGKLYERETLSPKLSWSHFFELLTVPERQKREFYAAFAVHERWSVRTLRATIVGKQYERTIAARGSVEGIEADLAALLATGAIEPALAFRDPYVLDFLGLGQSRHSS